MCRGKIKFAIKKNITFLHFVENFLHLDSNSDLPCENHRFSRDRLPRHFQKTNPPWLTKFSPIRFNKYPIGTMMREHYDHIHSIFDGKMKGVPIISIVGQLNEDYEGAEFYCRGRKIELKTGDILLFPSNFMYPHEVRETKKGVRYSFVSWAF